MGLAAAAPVAAGAAAAEGPGPTLIWRITGARFDERDIIIGGTDDGAAYPIPSRIACAAVGRAAAAFASAPVSVGAAVAEGPGPARPRGHGRRHWSGLAGKYG